MKDDVFDKFLDRRSPHDPLNTKINSNSSLSHFRGYQDDFQSFRSSIYAPKQLENNKNQENKEFNYNELDTSWDIIDHKHCKYMNVIKNFCA